LSVPVKVTGVPALKQELRHEDVLVAGGIVSRINLGPRWSQDAFQGLKMFFPSFVRCPWHLLPFGRY